MDKGTGYGMPKGAYDADLVEVGPETPMGEYLRRFWHAIEVSDKVKDLPRRVRILGEDLIVFREPDGTPGLVYERCCHRGASLFYGKVEDGGIRCCYHGWKFAADGKVVEQPCEPDGGKALDRLHQPWYPVQERYGIIWAYMGPPDKKPLLPKYNVFEDLPEGEKLFVNDDNIGTVARKGTVADFNWFQHWENLPDMSHFLWLHIKHSGSQFGDRFGEFENMDMKPWEWMQKAISWEVTERGHMTHMIMPHPDGDKRIRFTLEAALPIVRSVPNPWGKMGLLDHVGFITPIDDTHFKIITVLRAEDTSFFDTYDGLLDHMWGNIDKDPTFAQRFPADYEAQRYQGDITLHSEENLRTCDLGIGQLRRIYREEIKKVGNGEDPIGVNFEPGTELVNLQAGTYLETIEGKRLPETKMEPAE